MRLQAPPFLTRHARNSQSAERASAKAKFRTQREAPVLFPLSAMLLFIDHATKCPGDRQVAVCVVDEALPLELIQEKVDARPGGPHHLGEHTDSFENPALLAVLSVASE